MKAHGGCIMESGCKQKNKRNIRYIRNYHNQTVLYRFLAFRRTRKSEWQRKWVTNTRKLHNITRSKSEKALTTTIGIRHTRLTCII